MINWIKISKAAGIVVSIGLVFTACEDFADETYELTSHDAAAIAAMEDTLEVGLTMKRATILNDISGVGVILSGGGTDTILMAVDTSVLTLGNISSALTAADISPFSANDTAFAVSIGDDSLAYRVFSVVTAGTYYLYTNHHIGTALYASSSLNRIAFTSDDMSPELIAGLFDSHGLPIMKARYEYELNAGDYLFEIARVEATTSTSFRVVLISG